MKRPDRPDARIKAAVTLQHCARTNRNRRNRPRGRAERGRRQRERPCPPQPRCQRPDRPKRRPGTRATRRRGSASDSLPTRQRALASPPGSLRRWSMDRSLSRRRGALKRRPRHPLGAREGLPAEPAANGEVRGYDAVPTSGAVLTTHLIPRPSAARRPPATRRRAPCRAARTRAPCRSRSALAGLAPRVAGAPHRAP